MIRLSCISLILLVLLSHISIAQKSKQNDYIQKLSDVKEFKKFIRTHTNVLAIFTQSEKDFKQQDLFKAVGEKVKGIASIILFDCSIDKKSCKKLKSFPSPVEYKHFKDGEFHKVYDRMFTVKSMVKFLQNPTSDRPWEEEASASDVRHLETKSDLNKLLSKEKKPILIMFYAPWCGFCKKLKPEFAEAASILKGEAVLAGMDVDTIDGEPIRMEFNITGFPTLIYFKNGEKVYNYGGSNDRDGVVAWMRNPVPAKVEEPEKDWSEMDNDVIHLTEDNFDDIINASSSALVMFYAPWCGHCKKMKPEYEVAATMLKNEKVDGILTAIDVTKHQKLGEKFKIKGFPTVKYFKNGEEKFDVNERTAQTIVSFMKDPKEPPAAAASDKPWGELDSYVEHLDDENFKSFIKKKKHCLVIFYAPWCGHCKKSKPEFMQAAEELKDDYKISFAAVDCTSPSSSSTCQSNDVTGYPTFKYFNYGKNDQIYYGGREKKDFISFMLNPTASSSPPPKPSSDDRLWQNIAGSDVISFLDASTFASHLERFDIVVVAFFADGCNSCVEMRKNFMEAAQSFKRETKVSFAAVNAMAEVSLREEFYIMELPTIKVFRNGKQLIEFDDARTKDNFINIVRNPPNEVTPFTEIQSGWIHHITSSTPFAQQITTNNNNKFAFVFFYDSSNNECINVRNLFWQLAEKFNDGGDEVLFGACDCIRNKNLCKEESIVHLPTFNFYIDGNLREKFDVASSNLRNLDGFKEFLLRNIANYKKIEL